MHRVVFYNGEIYSRDQLPYNWICIENEKIVSLGYGSPSTALLESANERRDLLRACMLPGFIDSHLHVYHMGEAAHYVDLHGCSSIIELQYRVQVHASTSSGAWIIGFGWEQDIMTTNGQYPSKWELDDIENVNARPMLLWRACWHIAVVNSSALHIAQLHEVGEDGGIDVLENGELTGILREEATNIVQKHIKECSSELRKQYLKIGMDMCLKAGLTSVQTNDHDCWQLYKELQEDGQVPLRIFLTPDYNELGKLSCPPPDYSNVLLSCDRVKLFADGSLGAETAALRKPYCNSSNTGVLLETDADMVKKITQATALGYRVEVHAIGDRAAEQVVLAMRTAGLAAADRPILTHCQVLGPDIIENMASIGVIADIQPSFTITDAAWSSKRLDASVLPYSYAWKSLLKAQVRVAGGSDAPIETCNPLQGMYDAMYRCAPGEVPFLPEECLTLQEAVDLYTVHGAFACKREETLGQLLPGFLADFVLLASNPFDTPHTLPKAKVREVWVNGILRHRSGPDDDDIMASVSGNYVHDVIQTGGRVGCLGLNCRAPWTSKQNCFAMLSEICNEVMVHILEYLQECDIGNVRATGTCFAEPVRSNHLWRTLCTRRFPDFEVQLSCRSSSSWQQQFKEKVMLGNAWHKGNYVKTGVVANEVGVCCIAALENTVVTGSLDHRVQIWSVQRQETPSLVNKATCIGHRDAVWCIKSDGDHNIFTGSFDTTVRQWDLHQPLVPVQTFAGHIDRVLCLDYQQNSIVSGSRDGTAKEWDIRSGTSALTFGTFSPCIYSLLVQDQLVYTGGIKDIEVWDKRFTACPLRIFQGHTRAVMCLNVINDTLISGSNDNTLRLWETTTPCTLENSRELHFKSPRLSIFAHEGAVRSIAVRDNLVFTSSNDNTVKAWHMTQSQSSHTQLNYLYTVQSHDAQVGACVATSTHLTTVSMDGSVVVHEYET